LGGWGGWRVVLAARASGDSGVGGGGRVWGGVGEPVAFMGGGRWGRGEWGGEVCSSVCWRGGWGVSVVGVRGSLWGGRGERGGRGGGAAHGGGGGGGYWGRGVFEGGGLAGACGGGGGGGCVLGLAVVLGAVGWGGGVGAGRGVVGWG